MIDAIDFISPSRGWLVLDQSEGYAPSHFYLYGTVNGGAKWRLVDGPMRHVPAVAASVGALSFVNAAMGLMLVYMGGSACQAEFVVLRTSDGGRRWYHAGTIFGSDGGATIQAIARRPTLVINGGCGMPSMGVFRASIQKWVLEDTLDGPARAAHDWGPTALAVRAAGHRATVFAAYAEGRMGPPTLLEGYQSTNGGTWKRFALGRTGLRGLVTALSFANRRDGIAVAGMTRPRLFVTRTGGRRWQEVRAVRLDRALDVYKSLAAFVTHNVAYIVVSSRTLRGMWRTADGGRTWTRVTVPTGP